MSSHRLRGFSFDAMPCAKRAIPRRGLSPTWHLALTIALVGSFLMNARMAGAQSHEPIERLIQQLHQPIVGGRIDAAKKLAQRGSEASMATEALIECLRDNNADVRLSAAYGLGCVQTDAPLVLKTLVPLLADSDEHVRYSVQWAIARIAQGLSPELDSIAATELASSLTTAVKEIARREHQPRHLIATEIALARINQLTTRLATPMPAPAPSIVEPQPVPPSHERLGNDLASGAYSASNLLGRYQFIDRLSDVDAYPDALRQIVLDYESTQPNNSLLHYAVRTWGANAQRMIAAQLERDSKAGPLEARYAGLIACMTPADSAERDRLMRLAADASQLFEVRCAAFDALASSLAIDDLLLAPWMIVMSNPNEDVSLRVVAADALTNAGRGAVAFESRLIPLLAKTQEPTLLVSLAYALAEIAPASRVAFSAVHNRLLDCPIDSAVYGDLVDACGKFGGLASDAVPQLIKGLNSPKADSYLRLRIVESMGKIGPAARLAADSLVARIMAMDEDIEVKNAAAAALRTMEPIGADALAAALKSRVAILATVDESAARSSLSKMTEAMSVAEKEVSARAEVTSLLHALSLCGPASLSAREPAVQLLNNPKNDVEMRSAAAAAISAMGRAAASAAPSLKRLCGKDESNQLRAACLLSLASVAPLEAEPLLSEFAAEPSTLLQATAAFAHHVCGHSRAAYEELLKLLDDSDTDDIITQSLADLGPTAEPWLYMTACDPQARICERLACLSLICELPQPDWARFLPLLDDVEIGEKFTDLAEGWFDPEGPVTPNLLRMLRDGKFSNLAEARVMRLLQPDGLGAGGDAGEWQALTLQRNSSIETFSAADAERFAPEMAGAAEAPPKKSMSPEMPVVARPVAPDLLAAGSPRLVDVFYGTNRARAAADRSQQELTVSVLATVGGAMLAMVFCLVGFVRSGSRFFALAGLLCIAIAAPFGYQAAQDYVHNSLHAPISYSGIYTDAIEVGVCQVSIPPGHKPGELESPNMFRLELKQEVDKHVVLTSVEQLPHDQFFDSLHSTLDSKGRNILVFIHGYNVSFEDAARRTAQMAVDLEFHGAPVFYSWPSQANWYGYAVDKENIELSVNQIKHFLLELAEKSGADTINLVAHSMGNVGLTQALKEMENVSPKPLFNQVVLAAPDIDAEIFKSRVAPNIIGKARHVTLYTSQTDLALMASRYFNNGPRVGDSATGVPLFEGIDTIDATSVDSSLLGHSYYGSNVTVLSDLGRVLANQPISARDYLQAIAEAAQTYWTFDPVRISQTQGTPQTR